MTACYELVAVDRMHHEDGEIKAYRWMDDAGRPTEKLMIIKSARAWDDHNQSFKMTTKHFDGESAWCNAARYYSDPLHWSNQYHELPMHPPWDIDDVRFQEGEQQ